jgi:hypothetical protein
MRVPAGEVARRIDDVADAIVRLAVELIEAGPHHRPRFAGEDEDRRY